MTVLHIAALQNAWYFFFKPLDIIVHGLGTVAVAIPLVLYIQSRTAVLTALLLVPILWEVFQFFFIYTHTPMHMMDTLGDISIGVAIGFIVFCLISGKKCSGPTQKSEVNDP